MNAGAVSAAPQKNGMSADNVIYLRLLRPGPLRSESIEATYRSEYIYGSACFLPPPPPPQTRLSSKTIREKARDPSIDFVSFILFRKSDANLSDGKVVRL